MGDDGSRSSKRVSQKRRPKRHTNILDDLKSEWSLFWQTILPEEQKNSEDIGQEQVSKLGLDEVKACIKTLSQKKKEIHTELEKLNKELELNQAKLESLKLVGGDHQPVLNRVAELSEFGSNLTDQLNVLNARLKLMRSREEHLRHQPEL